MNSQIFTVITGPLMVATLFSGARLAIADEAPADIDQRFETHSYSLAREEGSHATLNYRLLLPRDFDPRHRYPLVVYLHGAGSRGNDNRAQLGNLPALLAQDPYAAQFPCLLFAPQCPAGENWEIQTTLVYSCMEDLITHYPVDTNRVYLTGFSMGGNGCWHLAAHNPDRFAAVVPVAGRSETDLVPRLIELPIWMVHGDADSIVSAENSRAMSAAINDAGGNAKYTELPEIKHDSWRQAYGPDGVLPWMFAQSGRGRWWKRNWPIILLLSADACIVVWIGCLFYRRLTAQPQSPEP